jgi:hypothetical protein
MPLACEECDRVSDDAHGWIAMVVENDELDTHLCVTFYCPLCAGREFNYVSRRRP